ncbi:MAG: hypothetical protein ACYSWO_21985 [Planctomycetota bacterium]
MIVATIVPTATHAAIPLFWLFCSMIIMPRYFSLANINVEDIRGQLPVLFAFTRFMTAHTIIYLIVVALMLVADAAVHLSLLRASKIMAARIWSFAIAIVEIAISLLLYLPLRHHVASMG